MLKETIATDLITALKAHDALRVSTLRLLTSAIRNEEIAQRKGGDVKLEDDAVLAVIRREVKQRNDAIEEYKKGGRQDLVDKETAEKIILESYLPAQLSDDALQALVAKGVATSGAMGPNDFGKAMKTVMALVQGRADGGRVSTILKAALTK